MPENLGWLSTAALGLIGTRFLGLCIPFLFSFLPFSSSLSLFLCLFLVSYSFLLRVRRSET